eukprot:7818638-Ditylum_brightwellii.AAC.1
MDEQGGREQSEVQEVLNFPPAITDNDCSVLREEVVTVMANADEEGMNVEKVLQAIVVDTSQNSYNNTN